MKNKILSILLMLLFVLLITGCQNKNLEIIGNDEVEVGCSIVLTHNFTDVTNYYWESEDENIASIYDGVVIGNAEGEVIITLTIDNYTAKKKITVVKNKIIIIISGKNIVNIGKSIKLEASLSKEIEEEIIWQSSDETIAKINQNGLVRGISAGTVIITASILGNESQFLLTVIPNDYYIYIEGKNNIVIDEEFQMLVYDSLDTKVDVIWEVSDDSIASIDENGILKGVNTGKVQVIAYLKMNNDIYCSYDIEVILPAPTNIIIHGENKLDQGDTLNLSLEIIGDNVTKEVVWESSNPQIAIVYQGIVLGINEGTTKIKVSSLVDTKIYDEIEITVVKKDLVEEDPENIKLVDEIIANMTLSQKIGQMFVIGFSGTTMSSSLSEAIDTYNFGNVIYMAYNVSEPTTLSMLSNSIQEKMLEANGIPGFITIDQEGGRVVRLINGGTHFISNMAMAATGDVNNTYLEGYAIGQELKNYGINVDFAPVLDVNNNFENSVIGIRSYSDNPVLVSLFGNNMINGLENACVMACSKHFPGHGNTNVDSHYGLPIINSTLDQLYQTELAPFISAINNGIDSIMTTHIIFSAIDNTYPATLSNKVITGLLREQLGYDGIIFTDGMEMGAVTKNFGGYDQTAVLAIKAGVDILTYTTTQNPITAHKALMKAVEDNEITEERINESVRRILLKKIKYGLFDDCLAKNENINELLEYNENLNINFAMNSLTQVKGTIDGLSKSKSTLIISPLTSYSLGNELESNSFANYACNYLKANGYANVDYYTVDANISNNQRLVILNVLDNYDQVIIAMSNVKTAGYTNTSSFVNEIAKLKEQLIVIALDTPYDLLTYENVNNYICVYGYQKATVIALAKYLNKEYEANGVSPVDEKIFK